VKFGQLLHKPFEKMRVFRPILHEDNDFHAEFRKYGITCQPANEVITDPTPAKPAIHDR
jgi:hypothetical protein